MSSQPPSLRTPSNTTSSCFLPYPPPLPRAPYSFDSPSSSPAPFPPSQPLIQGANPFGARPREFGTDLGNVESHPQLLPSSGLFDGCQPPSLGPSAVQIITKFSSFLGLDNDRQKAALEFNELPLNHEAKIALNYTHALHLDRQLEALDTRVQQALVLLDTIKESTMRAWSLSPAQQTALRTLLQHQLISPTTTFKHIVLTALNYVSSHCSKYQLKKFSTDEVIKATIKKYFADNLAGVKSKFRKRLVEEYKMPLSKVSAKDTEVLALIALHRSVAAPLASSGKKNIKGADTGFWKGVEAGLKNVVQAHGTDRASADIIKADRAKYVSSPAAGAEDSDEGEQPEEEGEIES
ncbi:hypothetical protein C8J57DRAFT_1536290 [Mycena rebaudengoi]|nr:hypothetical protein C8J57DRAFT_1536290 [Mycena rebaudengoi]